MGVFDPETQASQNAPSISADDFFSVGDLLGLPIQVVVVLVEAPGVTQISS